MFKKIMEDFEKSMETGQEPTQTPPSAPQRRRREVSMYELLQLEKYLDALYAKSNMDFEFTRHFLRRVNDPRNIKQITIDELKTMFVNAYRRYGNLLSRKPRYFQAVIRDINSKINSPFVIDIGHDGKVDLVVKTAMRKTQFHTPNPVYQVENVQTIDQDLDEGWFDGEKVRKAFEYYVREKKKGSFHGKPLIQGIAQMFGISPRDLRSYIEQNEVTEVTEDMVLETRPTNLLGFVSGLRQHPHVEEIISTHSLADGMTAFVRTTDGNAYEVQIRAAPEAHHFQNERGFKGEKY